MSVGGDNSPYRTPCGYTSDDVANVFWFGGQYQHYRATEAAVEKMQNTTSGPPESSDTPWGEPVPDNTYAAYSPVQYANLSSCQKTGYKIVFARKVWHGVYGFTGMGDDAACCGGGSKPAVASSPPSTKYLTLTVTCTASFYYAPGDPNADGMTPVTDTYASTWTSSVDRYSGNVTNSGTSEVSFSDGTPDGPIWFDGNGLCNISYCNGIWAGGSGGSEVDDDDSLGDLVVNDINNGLFDGGTNTSGQNITIDIQSGSELQVTCTVGSAPGSMGNPDGAGSYETFTVNVTLSSPYTTGDVNDDCDGLLAYWNLADDVQIPWRTDGNCTSGPFLTYYEAGEPVAPTPMPDLTGAGTGTYPGGSTTISETINNVDPSVAGDVLGAPLCTDPCELAYDPYFDFRFVNYEQGDDEEWEVVSYGGYAPSWAPNATQWTNLIDAASFLPCAFASYGTLIDTLGGETHNPGVLIKSKYAEVTLLGAPSHDFARPCGPKDAVTIDQNSIDCSEDGAGSLLFPSCANPCPVPPATGGEWNDNYPKGDWCLLTWSFNYRDNYTDPSDPDYRPVTRAWNAISCAQYCSQFIPCCPAAIYLSNNGETGAANSVTIELPGLACDDCYGSQWQMAPLQWMADPLWQVPAPPCDMTYGAIWSEDDGTGHTDGDGYWFYPQRPYEEARCSLPDGAPALPAGFYIGPLDVGDINAGNPGNVYNPPQPGSCWNPWWTWAANRAATIAANGRFACDYADPLAVCDDNTELDPP